MNRFRCDCGDPKCPSCGIAQGTLGKRWYAPTRKELALALTNATERIQALTLRVADLESRVRQYPDNR